VRTDELKRFIQQPITNELNNIAFNLREVSKNLKNAYANLVRKKEIQSEIDELKLQHKSVGEQVQNLRKSLKGLTDDDRKIIENKELFENEQTFIQESNNEIDLFKQKFENLAESLSEYPSKIEEGTKILNSEMLSEIQKEKDQIFEKIKSSLSEILKIFSAEQLASYNASIEKWNKLKKSFDASYGQIKEKASANESIIKEINQLEIRLRELTDSINERISRIKELGNPESVFIEEKEKWYALHQNKIDLLNTQASNFTTLSQGIIKAEVTRSINIEEIQELIINSFTGTRISKDKIENLCSKIKDSESPLESWKIALDELKSLAEYKILEDKPIELPETPILTDIGLNDTNIQRIVELFSPDKWLAMVTQEIEFEPHFFYSTGNEMQDVIPFSEASAGQQATALLSVLLNQEGNPLLIDQPEDDIDNRAINDIIENIWKAKNKRQLIFTSHNANLVVNGDAELVVCCDYKESSQQTQGEIKHEGAIDNPEIKDEITLIMEGGEKAFKLRKEKYGF
jgi:type III restriction enzyme